VKTARGFKAKHALDSLVGQVESPLYALNLVFRFDYRVGISLAIRFLKLLFSLLSSLHKLGTVTASGVPGMGRVPFNLFSTSNPDLGMLGDISENSTNHIFHAILLR
jgi:hypothetical protein